MLSTPGAPRPGIGAAVRALPQEGQPPARGGLGGGAPGEEEEPPRRDCESEQKERRGAAAHRADDGVAAGVGPETGAGA
jgi:hypothetical protein